MPVLQRRSGITRTEAIVAACVVLALAAMFVQLTLQVREAARKSICNDHLHNLAVSVQDYEITYRALPPGYWEHSPSEPSWSWMACVLPFVESSPMYDELDVSGRDLSGAAASSRGLNWLQRECVPCICPQDGEPRLNHDRMIARTDGVPVPISISNYVAVYGPDWSQDGAPSGCFGRNSSVTIEAISDGIGNTIFLSERSLRSPGAVLSGARSICKTDSCYAAIAWGVGFTEGQPRESDVLGIAAGGVNGCVRVGDSLRRSDCAAGFSSRHPGEVHFALGDARVWSCSQDINDDVLQALTTRAGSEKLPR